METRIIDGKKIAQAIKNELAAACKKVKPKLKVCIVGENPASLIYVRNKQKACAEIGIDCEIKQFGQEVSEKELLDQLDRWNRSYDVHGIIVQLPLPDHINKLLILNAVAPHKDVDGFHYVNLGKLAQGQPNFVPCTPLAAAHVLQINKIPLLGKKTSIINDTLVVGRPLALLLSNLGATVIICNEHTENLKEITRTSSIVVTAVGKRPKFSLTKEYVKEGATVIDIGINRCNDKIVGDAEFDSLLGFVGNITKVPGFGSITVAMLMKNTIQAANSQ